MKKNKLKTYKKIKNTRKFSLGKPIIKSGYESAQAVDTTPLAINEGYRGYGQEGSSIRGGILPSVLGTAGTIGTSIYNLADKTTSAAQAAATNIANAGFSEAGNLTSAGVNALNGAAELGSSVAGLSTEAQSALSGAAAKSLSSSGKSVAKAGLSKLGTAMAIAQMAKGTFDMGSTLAGYSDRLSDSEINSTRTASTNMRNGVAYQEISGPDIAGINAYTDAQNKASTWGMVQSGADIGAGVGSIVGSSFGPIGTALGGLAGTVLGGLTNWGLDAIFGFGRKRKKAIEDANRRAAIAAQYTNMQNESNAATQGLRNQYNETHRAAKGKNPGEKWSTGDYTGIQTPSGLTYGAVQGLAQPAEGEIDMLTGETHYNGSPDPNVKDSKKDIVPVGSATGGGDYFDEFVGIPGGPFADAARPYFKANELIKMSSQSIDEELQANADHKHRDEATKKYIQNRLEKKQQMLQQQYQQNSQYIQDLVMSQSEQSAGRHYSCCKTPRFETGSVPNVADELYEEPLPGYLEDYLLLKGQHFKFTNPLDRPSIPKDATIPNGPLALNIRTTKIGDTDETKDPWYTKLLGRGGNSAQLGLPAWAGLAQGLPYALQTQIAANRQQPYAANSYVSNANQRAALDILGRLGHDNTQDKIALLNTARQNRYNILNTGGLSQGQKAMLIQNGLNQLALGRTALNQDAYNKNAAYKQAYASEMAKYGETSAARAQEALYRQQEAFRQAVGAKQKLQEQARKNWYTIGRQALEDYNTRANAEAMRNLYDRQVSTQEAGIKAERDRDIKQNSTNPYSSNYLKAKAQYNTFIKNYIPLTDLFKTIIR